MDLTEFRARLKEFDALRDKDEIQQDVVERIQPRFSDGWPAALNPRVCDVLINAGISKPYQHQVDAILKSLQGHDVVLESPLPAARHSPSPRLCFIR